MLGARLLAYVTGTLNQGAKAAFGLQKKLAGRLGVVAGFRPGT